MSNVELLSAEQAPLPARPYFNGERTSPIVRALAQVPEFLETAMPFIGTVLGDTSLPERLKEIVVLRASVRLGCRYCVEAHTVVAWEAGLSPLEVAALRGEAALPPTFDERELAVVAFTDALAERPAAAAALLKPHFDDHHIVELVTVGATTVMLNKFATALGLPTSDDTKARLAQEGLTVA